MPDDLIRLSEAARIMGMTHSGLQRRVNRGLLPAYRLPVTPRRKGCFAYVSRADVETQARVLPSIRYNMKPCPPNVAPTDCAYIAGLLDGEGTIYITFANGRNHTLRVCIFNTDLEVLRWVVGVMGGSVCVNRRVGRMNRPCGKWESGANNAYQTLILLEPFARIKREQIRIGITFMERLFRLGGSRWNQLTPQEIEWREEQRVAISRLNNHLQIGGDGADTTAEGDANE